MNNLTDGREFYASPDDDTLSAFINLLEQSHSKVLICDYSFNLPQLATILPDLSKKGIEVHVVLDRSQSFGKTEKAVVQQLREAGIDLVIGTSSKHRIMHDKIMIVDDKSLYGSWNFTTDASAEDNFFVIDPNPEVAQWFEGVWQRVHDWIVQNEPQTDTTSQKQ